MWLSSDSLLIVFRQLWVDCVLDTVFFLQTLELPMDSRSSSGSSGGSLRPPSSHPDTSSPQSFHHLHRMNFVRSARFPAGGPNNNIGGYVPDPTQRCHRKDPLDPDKIDMDLNSYVQLSRGVGDHDYSYPIMDSGGGYKGSLKKGGNAPCQPPAPRLPSKGKRRKEWRKKSLTMARAQCRHCLETYSPGDNGRGACEYAPDRVLECISRATCVACAQCMLYHCMADSEGDFGQHPCACDSPQSDSACPKRWTALALLSLFVPCLWCYLPLRACHRCGVRCGACGGRHDPA